MNILFLFESLKYTYICYSIALYYSFSNFSHWDPLILRIPDKPPCYVRAGCAMFQLSRGISGNCVLCVRALHQCTTTHLQVPLTSCDIRGNAYGLITQTNLHKLQLFYLLNSYALHL